MAMYLADWPAASCCWLQPAGPRLVLAKVVAALPCWLVASSCWLGVWCRLVAVVAGWAHNRCKLVVEVACNSAVAAWALAVLVAPLVQGAVAEAPHLTHLLRLGSRRCYCCCDWRVPQSPSSLHPAGCVHHLPLCSPPLRRLLPRSGHPSSPVPLGPRWLQDRSVPSRSHCCRPRAPSHCHHRLRTRSSLLVLGLNDGLGRSCCCSPHLYLLPLRLAGLPLAAPSRLPQYCHG